MTIPMLKIRRPNGRLILTWKSPYVDKTVLYWDGAQAASGGFSDRNNKPVYYVV